MDGLHLDLGSPVTASSPHARQDHPHVVALPPALYAGSLGLGLLFEFFWHTIVLSAPVRFLVGPLLLLVGLLLGVPAMREFLRAKTPFEVYRPATALVTTGLYRYTRNPMYLGLTVAYVGAALLASSLWVLGLLLPLILVVHYGVVLREEQYLAAKFGAAYRQYQAAVRRWL